MKNLFSFSSFGKFGNKRKEVTKVIDIVRQEGLTYLSAEKLNSIVDNSLRVSRLYPNSTFVEAGCALGGSSAVVGSCLSPVSKFHIYDTFHGMPPPTDKDTEDVHQRYQIISEGKSVGINGSQYYGYRDDLKTHVEGVVKRFILNSDRVQLHEGLLQNNLNLFDSIAFAHIDVDWYDPVLICAERLFPLLELKGSLIFDDYLDYGSCKNAVDDYFDRWKGHITMDLSAGSCCITKIKN